ncbi:FHA domain-containing protein, partial [Rubripirellula amarantea]|nr:FHA domain-containing protein [Rubripirellula amarantea]
MISYLAVRTGPEKGRQFPLDPARPMHVGRGASCEIMLTDPVSSRFHAVVFYEDGNWHLRDTSSRNGTLVNGQKAESARLLDQSVITIGGTEMQLVEPDLDSHDDSMNTLAISKEMMQHGSWRFDLEHSENKQVVAEHVMDLYQLALHLLTGEQPDEVLITVLELLKDRTGADLVGLSVESGGGRLK